jgi:hypothetical protein
MNNKGSLLDENEEEHPLSTPPPTPVRPNRDPLLKYYKAILLTPGPLVSASVLITKGKFKKLIVGSETGASAAKMLMDTLAKKGLGEINAYRGANSIQVSMHGRFTL